MRICEPDLCCGCGACAFVCPADAVTMKKDAEGFLRPTVCQEKCISCGKCEKLCPVNLNRNNLPKETFAAYSVDKKIRRASSSGGVFYFLAKNIIENGGAVFGAAFDSKMHLAHASAQSLSEVEAFMGSKYLQSDVTGVYQDIKYLLSAGKSVLFSGTPCQCAAVKNVFGDREGLYLMDFLCHGVPSPKVLEMLIDDQYPSAESVSFRDKKRGWEEFSMKIITPDGEYNCSRYKDPYLRLFLKNIALRPSCYNCSWKGEKFTSDITVADFWGLSKAIPALHDDKGVSLVIVRSEKGRKMLEAVGAELYLYSVGLEKAVRGNDAYSNSSKLSPQREEFFADLSKGESFSALSAKYAPPMKSKDICKMRVIVFVKKIIAVLSKRPEKERYK